MCKIKSGTIYRSYAKQPHPLQDRCMCKVRVCVAPIVKWTIAPHANAHRPKKIKRTMARRHGKERERERERERKIPLHRRDRAQQRNARCGT